MSKQKRTALWLALENIHNAFPGTTWIGGGVLEESRRAPRLPKWFVKGRIDAR